ncbi:restriction endonuclease subunit S [Luteimonas sp. MC1572]|uniref:restriction endonuclease subunit S n=1 Tax=Luteimonas sp. MC1572 TaxID=2799325 RepID=UPI0018F0BB17|nr:restriction endonuclease subunit S [Luteimonas sp. MC1572]MBJ6981672.1 restriction endonuclease subunit S [Luteimonas sp. MC1572]QQO02964.1 restriction endonuclease subunit S [Luteimonas sp. MC1572]
MELRAGYKQTEVGSILEEWDAVLVGDFFTFKNGLNKAKHFFGHGTPIVNYMDVFGRTALHVEELRGRVEVSKAELKAYEVCRGDVFFTRTSETIDEIGVASVLLGEAEQTVFSGFVLRARPTVDALVDEFKSYCFSPRYFRQQVTTRASYTTRALINGRSLSATFLAKPPKPEQIAIATALSDVDALLGAQDALIAKKRAIKQGAMQELLTGKRRLPGFSGEWEVKQLGRLLESPVTDGPHLTPKFIDRGVPFLSVNNLVDGKIDWTDLRYISDGDHREFSRKCRPRKGDILFGKAASVGMVALVETEIEFNIWSPIALIRVAPQLSARFVYRQLQSGFVEKQVLLLTNSSSQGNIGMGDIERLEIAYPRTREEQVAIAALLDDLDYEITALETQRAKTAQLKQGMMQALLTGRIRLV